MTIVDNVIEQVIELWMFAFRGNSGKLTCKIFCDHKVKFGSCFELQIIKTVILLGGLFTNSFWCHQFTRTGVLVHFSHL